VDGAVNGAETATEPEQNDWLDPTMTARPGKLSRTAGARADRSARDGFILIAVLSVMALFAAMVGAISLLVRSSVEAARLERDTLAVDALVRAGVELAAYQLFALRLPVESVDARQIRFDAGLVTLSVAAEGGKIDLNAADPEMLAGAYRSAQLGGLSPQAFAGRVVDWRDADDSRSEQGAEAADYAGAGLGYGPHNDAFGP
jgi:general secretion pathway protein K